MNYKKRIILIVLGFTILFICISFLIGATRNDKRAFADVIINDSGIIIKPWYDEKQDISFYFLPSYVGLKDISFSSDSNIVIAGKVISGFDDISNLALNQNLQACYSDCNNPYTIQFVKSANIATMYVETASGSMDYVIKKKGNEEIVKVSVFDTKGNKDLSCVDSKIKGRGNSTWMYFNKKSFSIKFSEKTDILGMGKASKWVLLANSMDSSNLRNKVVLDIALRADMTETSHCEFVDLFLNGEYNGLYLLTQSPEDWYERSLDAGAELYIYSAELGERFDTMNYPISVQNGDAYIDVCFPKNMTQSQIDTVTQNINAADNAISRGDFASIEGAFDLESWAKKYIIDEVFENIDSGLSSSYFFSLGDSGLLYAGPVWDYDNSIGNRNELVGATENPRILYAKNEYRKKKDRILWYSELYKDEAFANIVKRYFEQIFYPLLKEYIDTEIDKNHVIISEAEKCNNIRRRVKEDGSEIEYIKSYLEERIEFLKSIWIDNKEYCAIQYCDQALKGPYKWVYVEKGKAVNDSVEYYKWFDGISQLYLVDTGEPYDLSEPVTQDIALYYKESVSSGRLNEIIEKMNFDKKVLVCIVSVLLLPILYLLLSRRKEIGI